MDIMNIIMLVPIIVSVIGAGSAILKRILRRKNSGKK